MTTHTYHCILGESNVSLSIDAASDVSLISASIVYKLNLPCIFDKSGLQRSPIHAKVLTLGGCYISWMDLAVSYGLSFDILLGSDWILPCQPVFMDEYPFISNPVPETIRTISPPHTWQQISVMDNLVHLIPTSHPQAHDVLASMLERCCADVALRNDLFVDHRVEMCCETDEERRDAVLHHLLNGLCVLRPDIPYCKSFGRGLMSTMNLSYKICMLLLSAHQCKRVTLSTFRLCCAAIGLRTNGSNHGHDLSHKLLQRLKRWGPLSDCEDALDMISCFESFHAGSLLELASLHNIHSDTNISDKEWLRDVIVRHFVFGECQRSDAALCTSVCSVLLPPTEPSALSELRPLILDAVINLGTKNTLRRALRCAGISHASSDSVRALRSLLLRYRDTFAVSEQSHPRQRGGRSKSEDDSGVVSNLTDIANAWPQRISHTDKARIVHDFRAATSSIECIENHHLCLLC